jgi:hypothetical protein
MDELIQSLSGNDGRPQDEDEIDETLEGWPCRAGFAPDVTEKAMRITGIKP